MLPDYQPLPQLGRFINYAGEHLLSEKTDPILHRSTDELMQNVANRLSLKDFGNPYFKEGLNLLLESINQDTNLTFLGKILLKTAIERNLENRLKFVDLINNHPEILSTPLNRPIIIIGLPRSGTTFLHRLLAEDVSNRGLFLWELTHPIPQKGGEDHRRKISKIEYIIYRLVSINMDHIHVIRNNVYEECIWLLAATFKSGAFWAMAPVYSYLEWCLNNDRLKSYEEYLQFLKIFQSQTPGKRLLLKSPAHNGSLTELRHIMPDAILVHTHRHPMAVCNSTNSLIYWAHCNTSKRLDVKKTAESNIHLLHHATQRNLFARKYHGVEVYDIWYEELLNDPIETVKKLYKAHKINLTEKTEANMKAFVSKNPQHKHGKHKYCADDFGIRENQIIEKFEEYMKSFGY